MSRLTRNELDHIDAEYTDNICDIISEYEWGSLDPQKLMDRVIYELSLCGVETGEAYAETSYNGKFLLLLEACNLAAKEFDEDFYFYKEELEQCLLMELHVKSWYSEGVVYFYTRDTGVVSCHNPYSDFPYWEYTTWADDRFPWSGIRRQNNAFELLDNYDLLKKMAYVTRPRAIVPAPEKILMDEADRRYILFETIHDQEQSILRCKLKRGWISKEQFYQQSQELFWEYVYGRSA